MYIVIGLLFVGLATIIFGVWVGENYMFSRKFPIFALALWIIGMSLAYAPLPMPIRLLGIEVSLFGFSSFWSSVYLFTFFTADYVRLEMQRDKLKKIQEARD